jgi:WD40 repeat protein
MLMGALALYANAQDVRKLVTLPTSAEIRAVSVCGSSGLAAGRARNGSVFVWRLPSGEPVSNRPAEDGVSALACSSDGKSLALGKVDGSVAITDISGKTMRTLAVATLPIGGLAFSPDGSLLAINVTEAPAQLWNPAQGTLVAALKTDFGGSSRWRWFHTAMDFSPDSNLLATADGDTSVRIYDRNGRLKATYSDLLVEPFAISFAPDGKQVVTGGADCTLTILDASDAHVVRRLAKQPDPIFGVAVLPDGMSIVSLNIEAAGFSKFTTLLWNIQSGEQRELPIDGAHLVGGGTTAGHKLVLFTADDSALTAWMFSN